MIADLLLEMTIIAVVLIIAMVIEHLYHKFKNK